MIAGTANAVNFTDGLDGLAAGTGIIAVFTFTAMAVIAWIRSGVPGHRTELYIDLSIFGAALIGAIVGFLWYNAWPAEIIMGDTGAMAIGGALASFAIVMKTEFLLLLIGGIFVIEIMSVIIQVFTFRYMGKRVFLMTPIHYHFEMLPRPGPRRRSLSASGSCARFSARWPSPSTTATTSSSSVADRGRARPVGGARARRRPDRGDGHRGRRRPETGRLAAGALNRIGPDGSVICLEHSAAGLDALRHECSDPRLAFLIGDPDVLPLPDESADVVLAGSAVGARAVSAAAAREIHRVLRPGGRLSLYVPTEADKTALSIAGFTEVDVERQDGLFVRAVKP